MKCSKLAALLLMCVLPGAVHAATDGTLGPTSTGTFTATAQINPPVQQQVQVFGLDDFVFAPVTRVAGQTTHVTSVTKRFCINNHSPGGGPISVTVSQTGEAGNFSLKGNNGRSLPLSITLDNPWAMGISRISNFSITINGNVDASCTQAALDAGTGNITTITIAPNRIAPDSDASDGDLQGQFSITISPS